MLEKCLVGRFVSRQPKKDAPTTKPKSLPARLRFDFRQPDSKSLTLFVYTTCTTLTTERIFVDVENSKKLTVLVFIDGFVHTVAIGKYYCRVRGSIRQLVMMDLELLELVSNDVTGKVERVWRWRIEMSLTGMFSPCLVDESRPNRTRPEEANWPNVEVHWQICIESFSGLFRARFRYVCG